MLTKSEQPGFVRIKDRIPYHGKGVEELTMALRKVLSDNKYTQKVVLEVGTPHIYIEKMVPEAEAVDLPKPLTLHDAIRTVKMDEYELGDSKIHEFYVLREVFEMVQDEKLEVCAIAVGNLKRFEKWLGFKLSRSKMNLFETPVYIEGEIPEDVFIVCGAPRRDAEFDDITYSVKVTI